MKTKPSLHKPFTKPFWKLLGISTLSLLFVYGGVVWATAGDRCREYSNGSETRVGSAVSNISGWSVVRKICQKVINDGTPDDIVVKTSNVDNKTVRIANTGTKDYFVPVKSDRELNAFLGVAKNGNLKSDITTLCEVALSNTADSVFGNDIKGCDDQICPAPTLTYLETGTPGNVHYTLNGGSVTGLSFFRSSDNQVTWSTQGTTPVPSPGLAAIFSGDYVRAQANCSDGSTSDYSNAITTGASGCVGTYTISGTGTKIDWEGNPLEWEQGVLYNDNQQPIYRCIATTIPHNVDLWHTTNSPSTSDDNSTWGDANGTDNYQCQYIGGANQLNTNGTYSCTNIGSGNWTISGGGSNNNALSGQSQSIVNQLCSQNYTTANRFWSPGNSGNWSKYITASGSGFTPGYVVTKNDIQGVLTSGTGSSTGQCSNLTSYGQNYCETNPANSGCVWVD